jgi:predicted PurR-regulated permease PerM
MLIALYYFLADGPAMIRTLMRLSPLDSAYEAQLLDQFSHLSRSVVVAMLLSAVVQGSFAGVGYYFALPAGAPVFLMTALTMILALVPFVGTAVMWVPTCAWLLLFGPVVDENNVTHFSGNWGLAIGLAAYCAVFVSLSDNLIKPLVLQGRANLHPLLALLSILGGVQVLGPVGILVGPMLVSFLQALLEMLHKELDAFAGEGGHGEKLLAEVGAAPRFANEAAGTASGSGPESAASPAKPAPASRRRKK